MYGSSDKTCFGKASFFKLNTKTTTPMSAVSGRSFSNVLSAYLLPFTVANDISTYKIVSRPLVIALQKFGHINDIFSRPLVSALQKCGHINEIIFRPLVIALPKHGHINEILSRPLVTALQKYGHINEVLSRPLVIALQKYGHINEILSRPLVITLQKWRERVSWCFTPNQAVRLYQGERERENKKGNEGVERQNVATQTETWNN